MDRAHPPPDIVAGGAGAVVVHERPLQDKALLDAHMAVAGKARAGLHLGERGHAPRGLLVELLRPHAGKARRLPVGLGHVHVGGPRCLLEDHRLAPSGAGGSPSARSYSSSVKPRTSRSPHTSTGTRRSPSSWSSHSSACASLTGSRPASCRTKPAPDLMRKYRASRASRSAPSRFTACASRERRSKSTPALARARRASSEAGQSHALS